MPTLSRALAKTLVRVDPTTEQLGQASAAKSGGTCLDFTTLPALEVSY